jgi:hypothetical protein
VVSQCPAAGAGGQQGLVVPVQAFALPAPVVGTAQSVRKFIGAKGSLTIRLNTNMRPTDDPAVFHEEGRWVVISATGMYADLDGQGSMSGSRNFDPQSLDVTYVGQLR